MYPHRRLTHLVAAYLSPHRRGMVTLKKEQQEEFRRQVNDRCRKLGCYFHGEDKDVSSDTFSTGTGVGITQPGMNAVRPPPLPARLPASPASRG